MARQKHNPKAIAFTLAAAFVFVTAFATSNTTENYCSYSDLDGDGYGYVETSGACYYIYSSPPDCNDNDAAAYPGAQELCNARDDNCNGQIDDGAKKKSYFDYDGDGYGDAKIFAESCEKTQGHVENNLDCDDRNPLANPNTSEFCDGKDNDCDGKVDEDYICAKFTSCTDKGGADYFLKGTCYDAAGAHADYCEKNSLMEYQCGHISEENKKTIVRCVTTSYRGDAGKCINGAWNISAI